MLGLASKFIRSTGKFIERKYMYNVGIFIIRSGV